MTVNLHKRFIFILVAFCISIGFILSPPTSHAEESSQVNEVKIGVLALYGEEEAYSDWNETARYLTEVCKQKYPQENNHFSIVPIGFNEIDTIVENNQVDFLIVNSNIYVYLEYTYDIGRIATLKKKVGDTEQVQFGGIIFTRANHPDIVDLSDINDNTTIAAVAENSLGGYLVQKGELLNNHDIDIDTFSQSPLFLENHKDVIKAILDGQADIGFVRTGTMEEMISDGDISSSDIRVLLDYSSDEDRIYHKHSDSREFPFAHSTDLYPEWPIAKLRSTSNELSERVATSLIEMNAEDSAAITAGITGWTIPLNYQPVHELQKSLKVSPYEHYGEVSLRDFFIQYRIWIISILVLAIILLSLFAYTLILNRKIIYSQKRISQLNDALRVINKLLRHDILGKLTGIKYTLELTEQLESNKLIAEAYQVTVGAMELVKEMKELESGLSEGTVLKDFDLKEVLDTVAKEQKMKISVKGYATVKADAAIHSIFENLFRNAKIHAKVDKLKINISKQKNKVVVRVCDEGKGIDPKIRDHLFDEGVKSPTTGVTGLGLYVIKNTMERYGGSIRAEDNQPKGAVFVLEFVQ